MIGPVRQALWALLAAVGVLLVISCATVSGLMLTRVSLKSREHAVRAALGASRARLGRLWLFEAGILSLAGGGIGLLVSLWIARVIVVLAPEELPRLSEISISGEVVAFTFAAVLVTALLSGVTPVRHATAVNGRPSRALRVSIPVRTRPSARTWYRSTSSIWGIRGIPRGSRSWSRAV